ncbi:MAG: hypothetical protein BA865_02500 [Desulfobacterales bacterium S5133MH4]|nr:MAG: hypothetical protein BA865_02500 [Desulfobacterales bacterium S5133MH4]
MKKLLGVFLVLAAVALLVHPSWATSGRETPAEGYGVHDFFLSEAASPPTWPTPIQDANHWYSSGLDVVYVKGVRHFIVLWNTTQNWPAGPEPGNSIVLSLYDYTGVWRMDLATYTDPLNLDGNPYTDVVMYPQSVKMAPDGSNIWVSYTANDQGGTWNVSDYFLTVPWDSFLIPGFYPQPMTRDTFMVPGNWEMEWSTDPNSPPAGQRGRQFVSALDPNQLPLLMNAIHLYTPGAGCQIIIDVGGPSSGFAFDNVGNLWLITYDLNWNNNIYMWTAADIDAAVNGAIAVLTVGDADVTLPVSGNQGGNDAERDAIGNVYFSTNYWNDFGNILRVDKVTHAVATITSTMAVGDWQRSLAFDGLGKLESYGVQEASNRLYLDMDQGNQGVTPPTIVGISIAGDADGDGVPDALDNCWQTWQPSHAVGLYSGQKDTDIDGYGDVCDSYPYSYNDYDGDGIADIRDWSWDTPDDQAIGANELTDILTNWRNAPIRPDQDHDADGVIGSFELSFVLYHWRVPQPLQPWWP